MAVTRHVSSFYGAARLCVYTLVGRPSKTVCFWVELGCNYSVKVGFEVEFELKYAAQPQI